MQMSGGHTYHHFGDRCGCDNAMPEPGEGTTVDYTYNEQVPINRISVPLVLSALVIATIFFKILK